MRLNNKMINNLNIKIFADGAENPTLMKKAGIRNYKEFALDILSQIKDKPISFEVFSDDFEEMKKQALEIASWSENVYVKIPITNTKAEMCTNLIKSLSDSGVKLNVTAMFTIEQVKTILDSLQNSPGCYLSIFAGRIADAGVDPIPIMQEVKKIISNFENIELIWASPRELLNIIQADEIGCDIITVTNDLLKKIYNLGKDLTEFSLDTVKMFYNDAIESGFKF